jgi:Notch-like protein
VTSKCECLSGYGGLMCELDINECAGNDQICGLYSCTNLPGDYKCDCDFFHSGKQCRKSKKKKKESI